MHRKREINLSTLAFIDVMACGLGAVILLFFVLDFEELSQDSDTPTVSATRTAFELVAATTLAFHPR